MDNTDASVTPEAGPVPGFPRAGLGESLVWCDRTHRLWWIDIEARRLLRGDPATGAHDAWDMPGHLGCVVLTEGDEVVVGLDTALHLFDPKAGTLAHLADLPGETPSRRANDGTVSRGGRLAIGTVEIAPEDRPKPTGGLHLYDGREVTRVLDGLRMQNGTAFSPDDRTFYVAETAEDMQAIWAMTHDPATGALADRRTFFDAHAVAGRPDGACVDAEGFYWMAGYQGAELVRLSPGGEIERRVPLPVNEPTRPCLGGSDLSTLYVTSIGGDGALDGAVLALPAPAPGLPAGRLRPVGRRGGARPVGRVR